MKEELKNMTRMPPKFPFISDSACYPIEYPNQKPHLVFTFNPSELCAAFTAAV